MGWIRWIIVFLAVVEGGFMVFDGGHALVVGDYLTPSKGPWAGQLGYWAGVVQAAGIEPRSTLMKLIFVMYGSLWLVITYFFARGRSWGRLAMLAMAFGSLWYIGIGLLFAFTQILLLVLLPRQTDPVEAT